MKKLLLTTLIILSIAQLGAYTGNYAGQYTGKSATDVSRGGNAAGDAFGSLASGYLGAAIPVNIGIAKATATVDTDMKVKSDQNITAGTGYKQNLTITGDGSGKVYVQ